MQRGVQSPAYLERALIGCLFADPDATLAAIAVVGLRSDDLPTAGPVLEAARALQARRDPIGLEEVTAELEARGELAAIGGATGLSDLVVGLPDPTHAAFYACQVRRGALLRRLPALVESCASSPAALDALEASVRDLRQLEGGAEAASITHLTTEQLLELAIPPREWIAQPVFRQKDSVMVAGGRGVGKTWFLLELALGLATGETILERWRAPRRHRVLLVNGEDAGRATQERVSARILAAGFDPGDYLRFLLADLTPHGLPNIADASGQAFFDRMIEETRAEILILDNLSCLTQGLDENDALAWEPVQTWLVSLRRRGVATFFGHHLGKSGAQRGTSRREDVIDASIILEAPQDDERADGCRFVVKFSKARGISGRATAPFEARLVPGLAGGVAWAVQDVRNETDEMIAEMAAAGRPVRAIAAELGVPRSTVHRRLHRLRNAGGDS